MIVVHESAREYFHKVACFARDSKRMPQLRETFDRLNQYARSRKCVLYKDFAPMSFAFNMYRKMEDDVEFCCGNGGVIFHGAYSGDAPTFSVCVEPCDGWQIHT